jgi:YHS domain-containing protein
MKTLTKILALAVLAGATTLLFVGCSSSGHDHSSHSHGTVAAKPYPLTKCLVTDEGFNHGKPYTFVHQGQEIKLCCEDCLADFKKEPAKYLSKLNTPK